MDRKNTEDDLQSKIAQKLIQITDTEYGLITAFVYSNIGINLSDEKRNLLTGRLQKKLKTMNFTTFGDYYDYLTNDKTGEALSTLANLISTNYTYFWRENDHFEFFLKTSLPQIDKNLKADNSKDLRVWCAGCSTGEEAYTLVILMMEYFGPNYASLSAGVLATDISEKALAIAKAGVYSAEKMKPMPPKYVTKYFNKMPSGDYQVKDIIKKEVTFGRFNFMNPVFPFKKQFNTIFCRNVMIYFDTQTRETLTEKFYKLTAPGGFFFIGHSETLGRSEKMKYNFIKPAVYIKV